MGATIELQPGFDGPVIPPFLTGCIHRTYAAIFSFYAGVMPPMPVLGRSLLLAVPSRTITLTLGDLPFSWQDRF
jgi:hypothetical protein